LNLPPLNDVTLRVDRQLWVKADIVTDMVVDHSFTACKFATAAEWKRTPDQGGDLWSAESCLIFEGPPSFKLDIIALQVRILEVLRRYYFSPCIKHCLILKIPFSGIGNVLIGRYSIALDSGIAADGAPPAWEPPSLDWCDSRSTDHRNICCLSPAGANEALP
jgi:hypothetical protein